MDGELFLESGLPAELEERVRGELREGERLLWVGRPRLLWFPREGVASFGCGIPFTAFALFWTWLAAWIVSGNPGKNDPGVVVRAVFPMFGLVFVVIGLGLLSTPYWLRRKARQTCYAVTDARAIVFEGSAWKGFAVRSYRPHALRSIERVEYPDGSGDLVFEGGRGRRRPGAPGFPGFRRIDQVREVEGLLRKALAAGQDDAAKG